MVPVLAYDNPIIMSRPTTASGRLAVGIMQRRLRTVRHNGSSSHGVAGRAQVVRRRREQEEGARRQVAHQAQVGILHSQSAVVTLVLRRVAATLAEG